MGAFAEGSSQGQETGRSEGQQRLIVKPLPPVKPAAAPLQPVPIEHSPSYLLRDRSRQVGPSRSSMVSLTISVAYRAAFRVLNHTT